MKATDPDETSSDTPVAGVIIPAHNEERSIGRLLRTLVRSDSDRHLDIVVVCNGCTDHTAREARSVEPSVRVLEIAEPSKQAALKEGNRVCSTFPRIYLDADVEIDAAGIDALVDSLAEDGVLASAPRRVVPRSGVSWLVRSYYDVWERLPQVQSGLFGRGVIAMSELGHSRVVSLPPMMSDDLAISEAFTENERVVVDSASVVVRPPRTVGDLIRRRSRIATGSSQAETAGLRSDKAKTSVRSLIGLCRNDPRLVPKVGIFLLVTVVARLRARRAVRAGDFSTWARDTSSRQ